MGNHSKFMAAQLGMPQGTASAKLKKALLYDMAKKLDRDICYRCGVKIGSIDEFSIEHKVNWLNSGRALELFLDINNIAFSHHLCNIRASAHKGPNKGGDNPTARRKVVDGRLLCRSGNHYVPTALFGKDHTAFLGYTSKCRQCRSTERKERYKQGLSR